MLCGAPTAVPARQLHEHTDIDDVEFDGTPINLDLVRKPVDTWRLSY